MLRGCWCAMRCGRWISARPSAWSASISCRLGLADLEEIVPQSPDLILIPKVETPEQVSDVVRSCRFDCEAKRSIARPIWLMPILESALGIENAFAIAKASDRIAAITIGLEDYTADLGVAKTPEGTESLYARQRVVNAAHAAHVQAIDSVYGDVADSEGLLRWGEASRAMGFEGMGCIHPIQIEIIHRAFAPTVSELEKALKIVAAYEDAQARGLGVVSLGSKMIDAPVVQRALKLVARARQMGIDRRASRRRRTIMSAGVATGLITNAIGRRVPTMVNGREQTPYAGVDGHRPTGCKAGPPIRSNSDYPTNGDKRVPDLETALRLCGLRDGMTISSHHHLRNGDRVALTALQTAARMGAKDLVWFPSASFPCHEPVIDLMKSGAVHHIEGSMNGPLGDYCSHGHMRGLGVLRSHGGRWQAVQDGEVHIDIAVIAAPTADFFGNADGSHGKSACGSLGFALADSIYADRVIVVTDNLVPFPCVPWQIQGNNVDYVVEVDSIGDPSKIVSGTTQITRSPDRLRISELVARFLRDSGIMRDGFSFQAGAGGIALAFVDYLARMMKAANVKASFVRGGSTKYLVDLLNEGLIGYILDGQTFDLDAVRSIASDPRHVPTSPFTSYNFHGKGNFASMVDAAVLGATEVDVNFNANVVTHSDGRLLHGIGGWQNCLFAGCTILAVPSFRDRIPVIVDEVTTVTGPGELIDVIATERGIAINPKRQDLLDAVKGKGLPIRPIEEIKAEVEKICGGKPAKPRLLDQSGRGGEVGGWNGARYRLAGGG